VRDIPSFSPYVNPNYFCEARFSSSLASNEILLNILKDHMSWTINGNHVSVSSLIEMFLMEMLVKKQSVEMLKHPHGVNKRLNP
jgi:hypothetical protein